MRARARVCVCVCWIAKCAKLELRKGLGNGALT